MNVKLCQNKNFTKLNTHVYVCEWIQIFFHSDGHIEFAWMYAAQNTASDLYK